MNVSNFDLGVDFQGVYGNKIYNYNRTSDTETKAGIWISITTDGVVQELQIRMP